MRFLFFLPFLVACSSTPKWLENRAACSLDRAEAYVVSKWGPVGIATRLADADVPFACGAAGGQR